MKSNIFSKTISVFLTMIFIFGLFPSAGFAQSGPSSPLGEVKGFNKTIFDSHFSRADREINPDRWLTEAKLGVTQAIYAWELIACGLYENPLVFEEAKNQLEKWSNEELEYRFSQWLVGRFFGAAVEKILADLSILFDETQKNYSWHLDDKGNIIFDDKTGDPLVIRPGEENREFSQDLLKWQEETEILINTKIKSLDDAITRLYPELLAYIPEELRETMNTVIIEAGSTASESVKREFENIAAREERIFTSRRTRDIWSLRKKSDDEAAKIFTERLLAETEEVCARGVEELITKIEEASAGSGDLAVYGEEWLQLYREQFERGLKAWEEAEERFFIRRIEWEQESFKLFSEGEETWLAAFIQFEEERKKWELKTKDLFNSGELLFRSISTNLEKNIAEAKQEFELNMALRIGTGTTRVKAMIDMYLLNASAMITTQDTIKFWLKEFNDNNKKDFTDPDFNDWLQDERKKLWVQAERDSTNRPIRSQIQDIINGKMTFAEELAFYYNHKNNNTGSIYFSNTNKRKIESLLELKKSYDLYISYMEKATDVRDIILKDYAELLGTGTLKDILSPGASSEDFCLDEYQIALIRAKALVLYWENKTSIAEAVLAYANELDAGRMTEAEGIRAWEKAKAAYYESLDAYETELLRLNKISMDISEQQAVLDNFVKKMQAAEEQLNRLYNESSLIDAVKTIVSENIALQDFDEKYEALVDEYKNILKTGAGAAYKYVLENGLKWGISEQREAAENILRILINGDDAGLSSLAELERNVFKKTDSEINLKIRLAAIDLFSDSRDGQLRPLYSVYSGAEWYSKAKGSSYLENEYSTLSGEKLGAQLVEDYKNSFRILLEKRIEFELEALLNFLENKNAELCLIDAETAAYIYAVLLNMEKRFKSGEGYFTENNGENEIITYFISGGSFFIGLERYYIEYLDDYLYCSGLLDLFNEYAIYSPFVQEEIWQDTGNSLKTLFTKYSIGTPKNILPDAKSIFNSISKRDGDIVTNTARFLMEFDNCFNFIPQWLDNEITGWKKAIVEYIAANILNSEIRTVVNKEILSLEQTELTRKHEELYVLAISQTYMNKDEEDKIHSELLTIRNSGITLHYMYQMINILENFRDEAIAHGNEKHWRQYLDENVLSNYDLELISASTWNEGVSMDALFNAVYYTNRINDAFTLISQNNIVFYGNNSKMFSSLYKEETLEIDDQLNSLKSHHNEIVRLGKIYEISKLSLEEATEHQKALLTELETRENALNSLRNEYLLEAEKFLEIGMLYDKQYGKLKKAYDETEIKRHEYEKQDAIQRWASTAYLGTDNIIPDEYKNKLAKAQTVLSVLSDLYNNESRRPYDDPQYDALYSEYEQRFSRKLKILETVNTLMTETAQERTNNENIMANYKNALNSLGNVSLSYSDYRSPVSQSGWTIKDIITVQNGRLVFSKNGSMTLSGIDDAKANALENYFKSTVTVNGERHEISLYESALRDLAQRMSGYLSNNDKFKQWSLARDYLITSLIKANGNIKFLNGCVTGLGEARKNGSLGSVIIQTDIGLFKDYKIDLYSILDDSQFIKNLDVECLFAWITLSAEEKADLEFYTILSLSGNNQGYFAGFSQMYTLAVYEHVHEYVKEKYNYAKDEADKWYTLWVYDGMEEINKNALGRVESSLSFIKRNVQGWINGLRSHLKSVKNYASAYSASCNKLSVLEGTKENGQRIAWNDINIALTSLNEMKNIEEMKTYWERMQAESGEMFQNVQDALLGLLQWARVEENKSIVKLEGKWASDERIRQNNEYNYQLAEEGFLEGTVDIKTLKLAAENAYGKKASSWIYHFEKMYTSMLGDLSLYLETNGNFYSEFGALGDSIIFLTSVTIENRYIAELTARETEWKQMRKDILEKYHEWLDASAQILENGRTDWNAGLKKMEDAYKQWKNNFQIEYDRVSAEWAVAYLASLEDKERWLEQAASTAYNASTESMLSLIGTEAERLSRFMDIREPLGIRGAIPEAETLMAELLQASGIVNMANMFGSLNSIAGTASPLVKRGMGGITVWDSALTKTAASDLAKKTNAEIANAESRKLARNARNAADEAIKTLTDNVKVVNKNFEENMDNYFILGGLWRRSGNNYIKDVITGSTLFQPVISKTVTVAGYRNYTIGSISLQTNMDEDYLTGLDSIVIMELIQSVYKEVDAYFAEIFGIDGESIDIIKQVKSGNKMIDLEKRTQSPGKFGAHIGYEPAVKPPKDFGNSRDSIFYDEGKGELGRLLSEYTYWYVIDSAGSAEITLAPWDKRMWDDKDSFFKAPTLRSTGQIAGAIYGTIVGAAVAVATDGVGIAAMPLILTGINSASDALFGVFDAAFGYKSIDEAAFDIGKSLLINAAGSLTSGLFSGIAGVGSGIINQGITSIAMKTANDAVSRVITQTIMTGAQTFTTGLVNSAISGITYNHIDGLGYSNDIFMAGINGMLKNSLTSMASTFTSGTLQAVNSGSLLENLIGFNKTNKSDISKFNNLAGALVGQGVNYALGNDFTLNILNLGLFTDGNINSGLLELHLGRDGSPTMNIGTGGANISIENLAAAFKGAQVWNVNNRISNYTKKNDFDAKIALRAQYGFGDDKQYDQLWDILKGRAEIRTNAEGDFSAETRNIDGKRVINFSGYQSGMSIEDQFFLAVILGHEAYRDGFVTDDNYLETRMAVNAHTEMALRMLHDGQNLALNDNLLKDIIAYSLSSNNIDFFNAYVDGNYDSSQDYWKLTREGNLEYDGLATLRDADGNILKSYRDMGLRSDNSIEYALLWLLNIKQDDSANVIAVRKMMENSGLKHSFDTNSENWIWGGEHTAITGFRGPALILGTLNLTEANMGKTITVNAIAELFTKIGASGETTNNSINRIYGSAIDFLNYANAGGNTTIANSILLNHYTPSQLAMIQANQSWLNEALRNGVNINGMVSGNPARTTEFGVYEAAIRLLSSSVEGASYFSEMHTGIDYGAGGTDIYTPGGIWQLINTDDHKAYYRLYGGDLTMRIQHLNPDALSALERGTIYSEINNLLVGYPTESYGSGSGAHIHIDMTRSLPYNGTYVRQFVNPETLLPGNRFEYRYSYMDASMESLPGHSGNFYRY
jgi:hypothetical protein